MISQSNIGDDIILRPVIANPSVSKETIDEFVDEITSIGNDIIRNIPFLVEKQRRNHAEGETTVVG